MFKNLRRWWISVKKQFIDDNESWSEKQAQVRRYREEIDLHGCNIDEARMKLNQVLNSAPMDIGELRVIHGFNSGTVFQQFVRNSYRHKRIERWISDANDGVTTLILK